MVTGHSTHSFFILASVLPPTTPLSESTFSFGTLIRVSETLISTVCFTLLSELTEVSLPVNGVFVSGSAATTCYWLSSAAALAQQTQKTLCIFGLRSGLSRVDSCLAPVDSCPKKEGKCSSRVHLLNLPVCCRVPRALEIRIPHPPHIRWRSLNRFKILAANLGLRLTPMKENRDRPRVLVWFQLNLVGRNRHTGTPHSLPPP